MIRFLIFLIAPIFATMFILWDWRLIFDFKFYEIQDRIVFVALEVTSLLVWDFTRRMK